ncbi:MAG TPA: hypothetical protein VMU21_06660, partial [Thermodesulfovibrionales bacterium]|nr:hypothetical protein [Thermodesulfovibrionales bacterium]
KPHLPYLLQDLCPPHGSLLLAIHYDRTIDVLQIRTFYLLATLLTPHSCRITLHWVESGETE